MKVINTSKFIILLIVVIIGFQCNDPQTPTEPDDIKPGLIKKDSIMFSVNHFVSYVTNKGKISDAKAYYSVNDFKASIFNSGLWLGAYQNNQPKSNSLGVSASYKNESNYTSRWKDTTAGVYFVTKDALENPDIKWPVNYGAPIDQNNKPILYGDEMCFLTLHSDTTISANPFSSPIKNIKITQFVYGYKRFDLNYILFVKYNIENLSDVPIQEMYAGYWADIDILGNDLVGYNTESAFTYTYPVSNDQNGKYYLIGCAFLQSPSPNQYFGVGSHRIMRKNLDEEYGEYTEEGPISTLQIIYALKGLTNQGNPMINPATNMETKYAFTGDPVKKTGWLDSPRDTRSLISSDPFTLAGKQAKTLTVVLIAQEANTLIDAINNLKNKIIQIRSEPSLWNF